MSTAAPHHAAPRRMSLEEWASLPKDEPGELVDGELVEEEEADWDHAGLVAWMVGTLGSWIMPRGGRIYGPGGKFALRPGLGRKADVSVFLPGTPLPPRRGVCPTPPDIMVEVISSEARDKKRDRIEKAAEYAAFGVRFYGLVDPDERTFEILELAGGRYQRVRYASAGTLDVPGCEGLRLDLDAMWAYVERRA